MAMSPMAIRSYYESRKSGFEPKGSGRKFTPPEVWKNKPSILWLIERAPTEEILIGLLEEAVRLEANKKTRRRWADAAQVRFEWLKAHPPTFEKVSVAEFEAIPTLVNDKHEALGFEAQRKGVAFDQCPFELNEDAKKFADEEREDEAMSAADAWRHGWLLADQTPLPVTDDRPKVADVQSFVVDEVNAHRQWFCAQNGIFSFEGPGGKIIPIHEYFQTPPVEAASK